MAEAPPVVFARPRQRSAKFVFGAEMQLAKDAVVADRFRLNRLLGRGGMGSVWHATHLGLDVSCAVKFIEGEHAHRPGAATRFEREAKAAAKLHGRNVVQILDHGIFDGTPYIAMELLEGEDLGKRLDRVKRLSPQEVVKIVTDVARALRKAHGLGIVHRDLKPENIFLVQDDDDREIVKVLDFGIAKVAATELKMQTRTGELLGTPHYMSPEQAQGNREIDWRSDLWSLAVITFECLTGRRPFDSDGLGELLVRILTEPIPVPSRIADLSPSFDLWWKRAVARDPAGRFQTASALAESLAIALAVDLDAPHTSHPQSNELGTQHASARRPMLGDAPATDPTLDARTTPDDDATAEIEREARLRKTGAAAAREPKTESSTLRWGQGTPDPAVRPTANHEDRARPEDGARPAAVHERSSPAERPRRPDFSAEVAVAQDNAPDTPRRDEAGGVIRDTENRGGTHDGASMRIPGLRPRVSLKAGCLPTVIAGSAGLTLALVLSAWLHGTHAEVASLDKPVPTAGDTNAKKGNVENGSREAHHVTVLNPPPLAPAASTPASGLTIAPSLGGAKPSVEIVTGQVTRHENVDEGAVRMIAKNAITACHDKLPTPQRVPASSSGTLSLVVDKSGHIIRVIILEIEAKNFVDCAEKRLIGQAMRVIAEGKEAEAIVELTMTQQ